MGGLLYEVGWVVLEAGDFTMWVWLLGGVV